MTERLKELVPNSAEWLAALEKINPQQAAITRAVVAQAGSEDGCSICGDTPARRLRPARRSAERPLLRRLQDHPVRDLAPASPFRPPDQSELLPPPLLDESSEPARPTEHPRP
jgi:hypothetical protein